MNVIITGASGFVGQNLTTFLAGKNHSVTKMSLRVRDFTLPENAAAIIHLAGKAHDTSNTSEPQEYFKVNTDLTKELFDLFLKSGARDLFFFSSVKAAADSVQGILDELHVPAPATPYGRSKRAAEEYLLQQDLPEGKRLFIIRPCMIHGPGNKGNLNLLNAVVQKGLPWPLAAFENRRSFLSIDNLNFLVNEMLLHPAVPSGIYNFADDEPLSTNEVVKIIAETAGKKAKLWNVSPSLLKFIAKAGDRLHLPLNSERLKKLTENYEMSNSKIKAVLGLENLPTKAAEGLTKTIKSFNK